MCNEPWSKYQQWCYEGIQNFTDLMFTILKINKDKTDK